MSKTDNEKRLNLLNQFDFKPLFRELGWDKYIYENSLNIENQTYLINGIADKRGFKIYECLSESEIPQVSIRQKIAKELETIGYENLIIFINQSKTIQLWQYKIKEIGKPQRLITHTFNKNSSGNALLQKLNGITITIEEEESLLGISDISKKVKSEFNKDKVTKKFYELFDKERKSFLGFLTGIPDENIQNWYISVIINRLMFIYFIQKKGFLNNDLDYLRNKLREVQLQKENSFYKDFLCPLFFEGFAQQESNRTNTIKNLLGDIPYLNGGLFLKHQIEETHNQQIQIPDIAFEKLFEFFEKYQWHLDDRPLKEQNEINPDILGHIFEKYINQKQMGAYYTKEDITDYISKNTIIPFLLNQIENNIQIFDLLQNNPRKYIYESVQKGVDLSLPDNIKQGINDISKRTNWNKLAPDEYALPTEIWREVIARRERYEEIYTKLKNGEIKQVADLITYNLDIKQFAQDLIETTENPSLVLDFYQAIQKITVLDPTCGSGAFLFAALNILETLYSACIERMEEMYPPAPLTEGVSEIQAIQLFKEELEKINQHPSREYFIYKSIILNNLYGVDIMEEATEICKLRLFLKLVSVINDKSQIEPLPDIDFNIKAGNALIGFASYPEIREALSGGEQSSSLKFDLFTISAYGESISNAGKKVSSIYRKFKELQTQKDTNCTQLADTKKELKGSLTKLNDELNTYLASARYGFDLKKKKEYDEFISTHQPFHWYTEFYEIIESGGFDVIIGNPPYVEYSKVKKDYQIKGYETESCGNLYAFVVERCLKILKNKPKPPNPLDRGNLKDLDTTFVEKVQNTKKTTAQKSKKLNNETPPVKGAGGFSGYCGMIVPHSSICTDRMESFINLFSKEFTSWFSTYCIRPSKLFNGVDQRLLIFLSTHNQQDLKFVSKYHRWNEEFRNFLFENLELNPFISLKGEIQNSILKIYKNIENRILEKVTKHKILNDFLVSSSKNICYYHNAPRYWIRAMDFAPYFWNEKDGEQISGHIKSIFTQKQFNSEIITSTLNSSLFYWWFILLSNCRDLTMREIKNFPIGLDAMSDSVKDKLQNITKHLMKDYEINAKRKETLYKTTGKVIYDEYYPRKSKHIIDEIDKVLAQHYGFTDEELDFIINYDIKYRMGLTGAKDESEE